MEGIAGGRRPSQPLSFRAAVQGSYRGLAPHQYVIARRVERAQYLLRTGGKLGLAEVAFRSGFANQSHFCFHFKRIVGVTPLQFRGSARMC
jgi:AraC family transcriptional regulator